jgi:curved DNA-binding protein CbpA
MKNCYEILKISATNDSKKIKSAYFEQIKRYHPDTYKGDKSFAYEMTQEINEAYNTLTNIDLKRQHDRFYGNYIYDTNRTVEELNYKLNIILNRNLVVSKNNNSSKMSRDEKRQEKKNDKLLRKELKAKQKQEKINQNLEKARQKNDYEQQQLQKKESLRAQKDKIKKDKEKFYRDVKVAKNNQAMIQKIKRDNTHNLDIENRHIDKTFKSNQRYARSLYKKFCKREVLPKSLEVVTKRVETPTESYERKKFIVSVSLIIGVILFLIYLIFAV